MAEIFGPAQASKPPEGCDPLRTLIRKLRIRRFLTTNYDHQIENALTTHLGCQIVSPQLTNPPAERPGEPARFGVLGPTANSLVFDPTFSDSMVQFAVAAPGYEYGVFHCHGDYRDPSKMMVTEADYQRVYLRRDRATSMYRKALDLAFSANPILFVGIGMREADLLRPLRRFVSETSQDPRERPLFALLPRPKGHMEAFELRRHLYARFGVKTIYYRPDDDSVEGLTRGLCHELDRLANEWASWWTGWQFKPRIRIPRFRQIAENRVVHHHVELPEHPFDQSDDEKAVAATLQDHRSVLVLGRAGAGKGTLGQRLGRGDVPFGFSPKRSFFATVYFSNDFLSIIEAVNRFLGTWNRGPGDPLDRLERALLEEDCLVVIGGIERLLQPVTPPRRSRHHAGHHRFDAPMRRGRALGREVDRFLHMAAALEHRGAGRLVLTSSLDPILTETPHRLQLSGVSTGSVERHPSFEGVPTDQVSALYHVLRGHAYALSVIGRLITSMPPAAREEWLRALVARMTAVSLPRRRTLTVQAALDQLFNAQRMGGDQALLLRGVLQRVALFAAPVGPQAIAASLGQGEESVVHALEMLSAMNLVLPVSVGKDDYHHRYTAHSTVRTYVLHLLGDLPDVTGEPRRMAPAGHLDDGDDVHPPTIHSFGVVTTTIDGILDHLDRMDHQAMRLPRSMTRAAFTLLKARWAAIGIGRQSHIPQEASTGLPRPHYDAYHRRLVRLINSLRRADFGNLWFRSDAEPNAHVEDLTVDLYADEFGHLYDELGLVSFSQGALDDAYAVYRIAQDVHAVAERGASGHRWCRAELQLAMVEIERGRLSRAKIHLDNCLVRSRDLRDRDLAFKARAYLGLVAHLSGRPYDALRNYDAAIRHFERCGNRRAVSVVRRHRADLYNHQRRFDDAISDIRESRLAAESGNHPELVQFALVAEAHLSIRMGQAALPEILEPVVSFARAIGSPKLHADALKVQGQLALERGQGDLANSFVLECLRIAHSLGMSLRLTSALVLLGRVKWFAGDARASWALLSSAIQLAKRQGYQLQLDQAERALRQLNTPAVPGSGLALEDV